MTHISSFTSVSIGLATEQNMGSGSRNSTDYCSWSISKTQASFKSRLTLPAISIWYYWAQACVTSSYVSCRYMIAELVSMTTWNIPQLWKLYKKEEKKIDISTHKVISFLCAVPFHGDSNFYCIRNSFRNVLWWCSCDTELLAKSCMASCINLFHIFSLDVGTFLYWLLWDLN